jgi:RNase P subunit RPR2
MRIIKEGKLPEKEIFQITCKNCSTVFEFFREEANVTRDQREGDYLSIACPLCKKIQTKSLPYREL